MNAGVIFRPRLRMVKTRKTIANNTKQEKYIDIFDTMCYYITTLIGIIYNKKNRNKINTVREVMCSLLK